MKPLAQTQHSPPLVLLHHIESRTIGHTIPEASYWLDAHTVLFIADGSGAASTPLHRHIAVRGSILLLQPGQSLHLQAADEASLRFFRLSFVVQQDDAGLFAQDEALVIESCSRLEDMLQELLRYGEQSDRLDGFERHIRFQTVLYEVIRRIPSLRSDSGDAKQAVERTIAFLHRAYRDEIEIGQLAQDTNLSRWQYGSLFKSLTGQTPTRYLTSLRIQQAKKLLTVSSARVNDIAARVGFRDEYYFSRRFKQSTGMSPTQYAHSHGRSPRIVSIQYLGELLALGIRPVGTNRSMLYALPEVSADVSAVDEPLDIQQLSRLEPDLILYPSFTPADLAQRLSGIATAVEIDWNVDVYTRLRGMGSLLGRTKEAAQWIERYKEKAEQARRKLKRAVREGETAAAFIVHSEGLYVYGGHHFGHTLYEGIGFRPPAGIQAWIERDHNAKWREIQLEEVPLFAGDRIFIALPEQGDDARRGKELLEHPVWQSLSAVREGKSYIFKDRWANYNPVTLERHLDEVVERLLSHS